MWQPLNGHLDYMPCLANYVDRYKQLNCFY